jgi:hypothetical protein
MANQHDEACRNCRFWKIDAATSTADNASAPESATSLSAFVAAMPPSSSVSWRRFASRNRYGGGMLQPRRRFGQPSLRAPLPSRLPRTTTGAACMSRKGRATVASRAPARTAAPLDVLLASVPSLPRALLSRLTARMIERMDELDGDPDVEPDDDCCAAGDDDPGAVSVH